MSDDNQTDSRYDFEILSSEYDRVVKESRSAIQVIGLSVSVLSVFPDLKNLTENGAWLARASLFCLLIALILALGSYLLAVHYRPPDYRSSLIGNPDRELLSPLVESMHRDYASEVLRDELKTVIRGAFAAYIFFSLGISCLLVVILLSI